MVYVAVGALLGSGIAALYLYHYSKASPELHEHGWKSEDHSKATTHKDELSTTQRRVLKRSDEIVKSTQAVEDTTRTVDKAFQGGDIKHASGPSFTLQSEEGEPAKFPPSTSIQDDRNEMSSKPAMSMAPPALPRKVPPKAPSSLRPPPSAASSLRAPPSSSRGPQTQTASLLAPSTSTLSPSTRPSKKVLLKPGHSPLDWAALTASPPSPSFLRGSDVPTSGLIRVTPSMLKAHTGRKGMNAWGVYQGKVYNMTPYMDFHPGGVDQLMRGAGREKDGERLFMEYHPWINWDNMLGECLVGILVAEGEGDGDRQDERDKMDEMD